MKGMDLLWPRSNELQELHVSRSGKFLLIKYTFCKTDLAIDICLKHFPQRCLKEKSMYAGQQYAKFPIMRLSVGK
jgi:hypothetical protein